MNEELKKIGMVFLRMLQSRKFWTLLMGVLVTDLRFDLSPTTQALIYLVAGTVFAGTSAWEDAAEKRAGGGEGVLPPSTEGSIFDEATESAELPPVENVVVKPEPITVATYATPARYAERSN